MDDARLAFLTDDMPARVRINFGIFAGRQATPAEIDTLAQSLLPLVEAVSIVAEERHEFDDRVEASVASVIVDLESPCDDELAGEVLARCDRWARECISARHLETNGV